MTNKKKYTVELSQPHINTLLLALSEYGHSIQESGVFPNGEYHSPRDKVEMRHTAELSTLLWTVLTEEQ